jgi:hypothetical protein
MSDGRGQWVLNPRSWAQRCSISFQPPLMKIVKNEDTALNKGRYNTGDITLPVIMSSKTTIFHCNKNYIYEDCTLYLLLFTDGRSNTCFMPAAWLLWNLRF